MSTHTATTAPVLKRGDAARTVPMTDLTAPVIVRGLAAKVALVEQYGSARPSESRWFQFFLSACLSASPGFVPAAFTAASNRSSSLDTSPPRGASGCELDVLLPQCLGIGARNAEFTDE